MPEVEFNKLKKRTEDTSLEMGDFVLLDDGLYFIVMQVSSGRNNLMCLETGNRYFGSFDIEATIDDVNEYLKPFDQKIERVVKKQNYKIKLDINWEA